jgi:hypothetical protein
MRVSRESFSRYGYNLLKAAGTPMMRDFPFLISSLRLTLLPGDDSTSPSTLGIESPTFTKARAELWKDLAGVREALRASLLMIFVEAISVT